MKTITILKTIMKELKNLYKFIVYREIHLEEVILNFDVPSKNGMIFTSNEIEIPETVDVYLGDNEKSNCGDIEFLLGEATIEKKENCLIAHIVLNGFLPQNMNAMKVLFNDGKFRVSGYGILDNNNVKEFQLTEIFLTPVPA